MAIKNFISSLEQLKDAINEADFPKHTTFIENFGWDHPALDKVDLVTYIDRFIEKISILLTIPSEDFEDGYFSDYTKQINLLTSNFSTEFENSDEKLRLLTTGFLLTLHTIFSAIENEYLSWEYLNEHKLLPKTITNRLKSASIRLENVESNFEDLTDKISIINKAHHAAERLPTDLSELEQAQEKLNAALSTSTKSLESIRKQEAQ
ncbi:hypothetical protein CGJ39_22925 [Vibrio parahaemolyticus]|uniref:hypothetical protein n=1 Tax=Vibrio parahaemolyticus TaxID=670 RepID=UPI00112259B6|nr:hypothetical protein [Vibrio parahaemolyticus]TOE59055.1 hypothetical protein CGJ39_22925 [Vibrio parahaemolyticus]